MGLRFSTPFKIQRHPLYNKGATMSLVEASWWGQAPSPTKKWADASKSLGA